MTKKLLHNTATNPKKFIQNIATSCFYSLSLKGSLIVSLLLLTFSIIIYSKTKENLRQTHLVDLKKLVTQAGSNAINYLLADVSDIESLTQEQAAIAKSIVHQDKALQKKLSDNLETHQHQTLLGAGYWSASKSPIPRVNSSENPLRNSLNALFWKHNIFGMLEYDNSYEQSTQYLTSEWFNIAAYAKRGKCVWSKLYTDIKSQQRKITCAVAVKDDGDLLKGVASVDIKLSNIKSVAKKTVSQIGGGYVLFLDKNGRLITSDFDNSTLLGKNVNLTQLATKHSSFKLINDAFKSFNKSAIYRANQRLGHDFDLKTERLLLDLPELSKEMAEINIALLSENAQTLYTHNLSTLFATANFKEDPLLGAAPASARLFHVPKTFWTMVIVTPDSIALDKADKTADELIQFLLIVTVILGLMSYLLLELGIFHPLRVTTLQMKGIAVLVQNKKYLSLREKKLRAKHNDGIGQMQSSVNLLIDRIVDNEGKLAEINTTLELRVTERTGALAKAMSDLKESQAQLIHAERMSLLGQMVAGVTHEVNTPLGYLKNNIAICQELLSHYEALLGLNLELKQHLALPDKAEENIKSLIQQISEIVKDIKDEKIDEEIQDLFNDTLFGVDQISDLVLDLKNFARLDESNLKEIDIHECIDSALKIAKCTLTDWTIQKKFGLDTPKIRCSPAQINQILLNLFNNASMAIDPNKALNTLRIITSNDNNYVIIIIEDSGKGMPDDVLNRIFEPFYSTKAAGEGTGLGLAICKKIIDAHNGRLEVTSKLGKGTCFTLYLPLESVEKSKTIKNLQL